VRAARGHYRDAVNAQRLAVNKAKDYGQAWCALALALRESAQTAEGLIAVQEALRLLPRYAGTWNLLGNLQQDAGQRDAAIVSYRKALEMEPQYSGAWFNLAELLAKQGQSAEAREAYGHAIEARPDFAEALLARAQLALDAKDYAAARADFQAATQVADFEAEALWGLSRTTRAQGQAKDADRYERDYRRAVRRRDKVLEDEAARGIERPFPFQPGSHLDLDAATAITIDAPPPQEVQP